MSAVEQKSTEKDELAAALEEAQRAPEREELWDRVEEIAASAQSPDEVAAGYRRALDEARAPSLVAVLGARAVRFHEEWYGGQADGLVPILTRVLAVDPGGSGSAWALRRASVLYTKSARWDDLLALYDQVLKAVTDGARRTEILSEAAHVAKDFAGDLDRAIGYLEQLQGSSPDDAHLAAQLERLLERQGRWADLVALWRRRLPRLPPAEARRLRERIAACLLERLADPAGAVAELRAALAEGGDAASGSALLERVLRTEEAPVRVRAEALELLRAHYDAAGRGEAMVPLLAVAVGFSDPAQRAALHREAALRLASGGNRAGAIEELVTAMGLAPDATDLQARLRELAADEGTPAAYSRGLVTAAQATSDLRRRLELWLEAARLHEGELGDAGGAIAFYRKAHAEGEAHPALRLEATRALAERLRRAPEAEVRPGERLEVLEGLAAQLAALAPDGPERVAVLGEAGRLADARGEVDRALEAFSTRLGLDPSDQVALAALVDVCERDGRWARLVESLRRRSATAGVTPAQRRADLARIAVVQADRLHDAGAAIGTWLEAQATFGEDPQSVDALADLLARVERWGELVERLGGAADRDRARAVAIATRVAEVCRDRLGDAARAASWYARALDLDPAHRPALAGAEGLLEDEGARAAACAALVRAAARTDDFAATLALLPQRLSLAADDRLRVTLLLEAAALAERRGGDPEAALRHVGRALALAPDDGTIERDVLRLGAGAGTVGAAGEALRGAAAAAGPSRAAALRAAEGALLEAQAPDAGPALDAYLAALELDPGRADARAGAVRCAARTGRWAPGVRAALALPLERGGLEREHLTALERAAREAGATAALAEALAAALQAAAPALEPTLARDLEVRLARLWGSLGDAGSEGRRAALERAAAHARRAREGAPAGDAERAGQVGEVELLRQVAALQRPLPGRALFETLVALADATPDDLDPLAEAAALATGPLEADGRGDELLERLLERATRLQRASRAPAGEKAAGETALAALEALVERALQRPDRASAGRALDLLLAGARAPFSADVTRRLRARAAEVAAGRLDDRRLAIQILQALCDEDPADADCTARLAALYEREGRLPDLLALRRAILSRTDDPEARIALRLEVERLAADVEARSGRLELLTENLAERPGHPATVEALAALLLAKGRAAELADLLAGQARRLEDDGEALGAARLWARLAALAEETLGARDRAIAAHARVAELDPRPETYEALGRLHLDRGDPLAAARWLEQWMGAAPAAQKPAAALRLAAAFGRAERPGRAVACLERLLAEVPDADDVRATLVELYRAQGAWEPLVRALGEAASRAGDAAPVLAWAREAADVAGRQLGSLAPAVPALERAVALAPGDRGLELALAEGALAAGDTRRARQVLEGLLGQAGRRRSRERALVHHLLARVARAEGKPAEALSELEQASEIDMDDAAVLQALAEVAEQTGDLERAERAYRALILLLRRDRGGATVSSSEVLLRLRKLALDRGEAEKAVDLLDSAMAAAVQDGEEGESFAKALRERGDWELLQALSEKRFIAATDPAAQARILAELAGIAERQGRPAEAFDRYLSALERAPEEPEVRAGARRAAREADASARLLAAIEGIVAARRRTADAALLAELLLLAGEIQEDPLGDRVRAAELYARAAATGGDAGPPSVRAAAALVRIAKAGGGAEARAQALEALGRLAGEGTPREIREEALFSLAELALPGEETRAAGLDALARALEISGALDRAFEIVRAAGVPDRELAKVLPLYERAARASGDDEMLLDFLERRAALPSSTPDEIKEAVELARALNETSRAERLLGLAVERGRARAAGLAGLDWALLDLAQLRRNAGDLAGAAIWLEEARGVADPARLLRLLQDLGQRVQQGGHDPALAARIFEQLWEQEPVQRRHFEPLLAAHVARGDAAAVERVARGTIEKLLDPGERNGVRLAWARFLLTRDSTSRAAVDVLRDALLDDPAQREAIGLLADVYERTGDEEGLDDLLSRELAAARERGDQAAVGALTARLGARTARRSPAEARALYRASLALAPDDPALLRALVELPDDEGDAGGRRELLERLLAVESGGTAAALAVELADAWEAEGDAARAARALALGRARAPGDPALFSRLGALYRERRDWEPLATLLVEEAERRGASDAAGASSLLREAALVEREHLGRPAAAALRLRSARALAPDDRELLRDLVGTLVGLGDRAAAIAEVGAALSRPNAPGPVRVALLRLRADLREQEGDDEGAVADLEEAHGIAGGAIEPPLREALLRWKGRAAETSDADAERKAVLRLHELYLAQGSAEEAREILSDWTWRHPEDRETLQILLARDRAAERWEEVVETCLRLLEVEVGEAQLATAATLSEAAARLGQPEAAMPGLETVVRAQPDHQETFDRLVALYEQTGERRKRATLLFWVAEGTADEGRRFALYKQAGELLLREGEAQAATDAFQRALALQPGDRELALLVAETCIADGRLGEAEEILEGLMARAGKEMTSAELSMLQHRMAQLAAARGDGPARLDWLKRSFDTNRKNGEVAVELADLAEEAEDFDTAVKALRAVTLLPAPGPISAAVAFYRQARIAQRTGDRPRALIFAKRALQEDPRLAEAAEFLKQIGERRA